jgi:hypothetical protein
LEWVNKLVWLDRLLEKGGMDCYAAISNVAYSTLEACPIIHPAREAHEKKIISDPEWGEIEHCIEFPLWDTMLKAEKVCSRRYTAHKS